MYGELYFFYHVVWKMDQHGTDNPQSEVLISNLVWFCFRPERGKKEKCTVGMKKY